MSLELIFTFFSALQKTLNARQKMIFSTFKAYDTVVTTIEKETEQLIDEFFSTRNYLTKEDNIDSIMDTEGFNPNAVYDPLKIS